MLRQVVEMSVAEGAVFTPHDQQPGSVPFSNGVLRYIFLGKVVVVIVY